MKNTIEVYLREIIDSSLTVIPWDGKKELPLFLTELYTFYKTNILGELCLLTEVQDEVQSIDSIKKHLETINKSIDSHVVFLYKSITPFRRKTLIKARIPFIIENGQLYLPFIGMHLKRMTKENIIEIKKFSSTTQLLFLYFLYNKEVSINATKLSKILKSSIMTASRALNDLHSLGLLTYEINGKTGMSKCYKRINDPDYYFRGSKYLKNPVKKVVYTEKNIATGNSPIAGLEALAMKSMLNPPKRQVRAVYKKETENIKKYIVYNNDKINDMDMMEFQIWNYDPQLLVKNSTVDLVSLALSTSDINDERVKQALEENLKDETWYSE